MVLPELTYSVAPSSWVLMVSPPPEHVESVGCRHHETGGCPRDGGLDEDTILYDCSGRHDGSAGLHRGAGCRPAGDDQCPARQDVAVDGLTDLGQFVGPLATTSLVVLPPTRYSRPPELTVV